MSGPVKLTSLGEPYLKVAVYGGTGVGKSIMCCTSQLYPTLILDVDDGLSSVRAWIAKHNLPSDHLIAWPVKTYADFKEGLNYAIQHKQYFKLLVIDTATVLQAVILREVCARTKVEIASKREWGIMLTLMDTIFDELRHVPMHVLYSCHESAQFDEELGKTKYQPAFRGQFGDSNGYGKYVSEIWRYMLVDETKKDPSTGQQQLISHRWLKCWRDSVTHAKDRSGCLNQFEVPLLDALLQKASAAIAPQG